MIFEKAWSKLHMSYEATAAGDTADATNYVTVVVESLPSSASSDEEMKHRAVRKGQKCNCVLFYYERCRMGRSALRARERTIQSVRSV